MEFPANYYFTEDHEWTSSQSGTVKVGISAYAIEQLGDIVHIDLPAVGSEFKARDPFGTIESTKTVSDLYMPGNGKILEVNSEIIAKPEDLQKDPYNKGWLIKVKLDETMTDLMDAKAYEAYIKEAS